MYALFNMCLLYPLGSKATEGFEQAYVPINVGEITTFIPIELRPDAIVKLSSQELDGYTSLAWTPSPQAEYYQIHKFEGGAWQVVATQITGRFYRHKGTGRYRVLACHKYGCSSSNPENSNVSDNLDIKAFYTQNYSAVEVGSPVRVGWELTGATSVTISHAQNGGRSVAQLSALNSGTHAFNVHGDSTFTLTAYGFDGASKSTSINLATVRENPFLNKGIQSDYKQPLFGLNLDIIERTVFQDKHHLIFSTHDGKLYFFRAHKEQNKPVSWQQEWVLTLDGVVNSAPVITEHYLHYNETNAQGQGRTCMVRLADKANVTCSPYEQDALLSSPVIVNNDGNYSAKFTDSLAGSNKKAAGIYAFYRSGKVKILDQKTLLPKPQSFTLAGHLDHPVITTPTLFLNRKNIQGLSEMILVKDQDQVLGVAIPSTESVQLQSRSVGVLSVNALSESKPMTILWKGAL
ncbi:hypothetical protein CWB99_08005 [Pseudoalteromonas rubra]|uniref:Uncharacterized protein n=2 Tax=Pseudoalteromonas rubra TaxID=43658 RepID=A0A5S3WPK9_9GAMM|nr:hypothetical protein CWB99_08005 [Pseudoalteromonas rubra]